MSEKYKSILFDLDGTLTDSGPGITRCAALALDAVGISHPPKEELGVFVGPPLVVSFTRFAFPLIRSKKRSGSSACTIMPAESLRILRMMVSVSFSGG